jgi:hypothetical protein
MQQESSKQQRSATVTMKPLIILERNQAKPRKWAKLPNFWICQAEEKVMVAGKTRRSLPSILTGLLASSVLLHMNPLSVLFPDHV